MTNQSNTLNKKINLKNFIVPTRLKNTDECKNDDDSLDTTDLVFLNSLQEIYNYTFDIDASLSKEKRKVAATDWALVNGAFQMHEEKTLSGKLGSAVYLLRDPWSVYQTQTVSQGKFSFVYFDAIHYSFRPAVHVDIDAVLSAKSTSNNVFKIDAVKNKKGKVLYHTMEFGEFPKSFVGEKFNLKLENAYEKKLLQATGKEYVGRFENDGKCIFHNEYEYNGQKYVRVESSSYDNQNIFSDGTKISFSHIYWIKVEPVTWMIMNWNNLPKQINPQGNDNAEILDLLADQAIENLPFNLMSYAKKDGYCSLWQNSVIRAYLNGYNIHQEIDRGNGNANYKSPFNIDFTKHNFLNEAFSNVLTLTKEANVNVTKRKGYGVRIADKPLSVDEQIKFYIEKGKSFMLHGPSGVGKTRRIEEVDPEFVSIVLRNGILPEEVIGKTIYLSDDKTKAGKWVAPAWYQDLCEKCAREPNKNHVLFIDEITNVKPSEQSLVFHLVLNHSIGPNVGKLPDNVVVVAAGNSMEESESAYNMPEPLFRRFDAHIYLKPDIQEWLEWGSEPSGKEGRTKIHPLVANFVATFGKKVFYSPYDTEEPPKHALDPRAWEQISDIIYDNDGYISAELIANKTGRDIAASFVDFAKTDPITVEDVVEGNFDISEIPVNFDAKFALAMSLINANFEQIVKVREFVGKYLGNEILATFDSIWVEKSDKKAIFLDELNKKQQKNQSKMEK